jgi:hypothetical protein
MTTTTRTIRKTSWAALTALLAVLAMVFGVLTVAAPAGATDENPGVCDGLDSGKIDVANGTMSVFIEAPAGQLIDQYCIKAGSIHQGLGPQYVTVDPPVQSMTITYDFTDPPKDISHYSFSWTPAPTYDYAGTGEASARECTLVEDVWGYMDFGPISVTGETVTKDTPWTDADKAVEDAKAQAEAESQLAAVLAGYTIDESGVSCRTTPPPVPGSVTYCVAPSGTTNYAYDTFGTADDTTPQDTWTNGSGQPLSAYTIGTTADCTPPVTPTPGSATYCVAPSGTTNYAYDTFDSADNTTPEGTWTNGSGLPLSAYTLGTAADCTPPTEEPEPVTVVEPAVVEPPTTVQPEVIAIPEPAKVPAPTATVPLPATVPAGDGSTVPTTPVYALALLALGATALAASAVRLLTHPTR